MPSEVRQTFVGVAGGDVLLDEGLAYARLLGEAGIAVTAKVYPGTVHEFFSSPDRLAPARMLLTDIAEFLWRTLGIPEPQELEPSA